MATITAGSVFPLRMNELSFYALQYGTVTAHTSSVIRIEYETGSYVEFRGSFVYDGFGDLAGGTLTSFADIYKGQTAYEISGLRIGAEQFYEWGLTNNVYSAKMAVLAGSDSIRGSSFGDVLEGFGGNDRINGGAGGDRMYGGAGNDTYYVESGSDRVSEYFGEGTDTVYTTRSYTLTANVENLRAQGTAKINLSGNGLSNTMVGNGASNVLKGGAGDDKVSGGGGNDVLWGGNGNDSLAGGTGQDAFVFNTGLDPDFNVDRISDFLVRDDTIHLENAVFTALGARGRLTTGAFFKGAQAQDASDRIVYDKATGNLFYDADGSGAAEQIQFAKVKAGLGLTAADFLII